ncbi:MAG: hypothetical protein AAFX76_12060, partial [Planctomycetota bacterium]
MNVLTAAQAQLEEAGLAEPENFAELMQAMPAVWTVLLGIALAVGLVLWAFGGRMAKKGVMLSGFVIGGLGAAALAAGLAPGSTAGGVEAVGGEAGEAVADAVTTSGGGLWVLAIGIGGAIAGVLLAALLFRFWMAGTAAVLLGLVVPLTTMVWQNNVPTVSAVQNTQDVAEEALGFGESDPVAEALRSQVDPIRRPLGSAVPDEADIGATETTALFDRDRFVGDLQAVWRQQVEEVRLWWSEMTPGGRRFLMGGAVAGAAVGLVLGLVLPTLAASVQSAVGGSGLIRCDGRAWLLSDLPG